MVQPDHCYERHDDDNDGDDDDDDEDDVNHDDDHTLLCELAIGGPA